MYEIHKNVPMPTNLGRAQGVAAALRRMEVGDRIVIEKANRPAVYSAAKRLSDRKIAVRTVDGVCRVWRIA